MDANIKKTAVEKVVDNDVNILEERKSLDVKSLRFKTVKVLEKVVKFKLESPTDYSEDKCLSKTTS